MGAGRKEIRERERGMGMGGRRGGIEGEKSYVNVGGNNSSNFHKQLLQNCQHLSWSNGDEHRAAHLSWL